MNRDLSVFQNGPPEKAIYIGVHVWPMDKNGMYKLMLRGLVKKVRVATEVARLSDKMITNFQRNYNDMAREIHSLIVNVNAALNVTDYRAASIVIVHQDGALVARADNYIEELKARMPIDSLFAKPKMMAIYETNFYAHFVDVNKLGRLALIRGGDFTYFHGRHYLGGTYSTVEAKYSPRLNYQESKESLIHYKNHIRDTIKSKIKDEKVKNNTENIILYVFITGVLPEEADRDLRRNEAFQTPDEDGIEVFFYRMREATDLLAAGYGASRVHGSLFAFNLSAEFRIEPT